MKKIALLLLTIIYVFVGCSKDDHSPLDAFPENATYTLASHVSYFDENGNELV